MVYHHNNTGRSHITAMLSEDDCKTWPYKLLLDERSNISYPDGKEADDGYIYIAYDRERGNGRKSLEEVYSCAREILIAKITEADIMAGNVVDTGSKLKFVASKLGEYADGDPYGDVKACYEENMAKYLVSVTNERLLYVLFEHYQNNCRNMRPQDGEKLDALIAQLEDPDCDHKETILAMIQLIVSVPEEPVTDLSVIERVKVILLDKRVEDMPVGEIARQLGMSLNYLRHAFQKATGITVTEYKNYLRNHYTIFSKKEETFYE